MDSSTTVKRFCFIGHVDHGKSTCSGHLYKLCGQIDDHEFKKIQKYCKDTGKMRQLYSIIFDTDDAERERGKTHEFNEAVIKYQNKEFILVDTPGHSTFIRSMIEGISGQSKEMIACLLVSASMDEFEAGWNKGQTREDILIARSVGILDLIVLVNKMDLVGWEEAAYNAIVARMRDLIASCRFNSVVYVPVSGYDGVGLVDTVGIPEWYTGPSLLQAIDRIKPKADSEVSKSLSLPTWTSAIVDARFFIRDVFVSLGFQCIMHYGGKEYPISIERIFKTDADGKHQAVNMVKDIKQKYRLVIKSEELVTTDENTNRSIFRYQRQTLGYGLIDKVIM